MILITTKQIVVRTKRPHETWDAIPNKQLIQALNEGYYVVMANPIGNELEYILEKSISENKYEGEVCSDETSNVADTNVENIQYPDDMDKECIPLCDLFNSIGLTTQFSCCGHGHDAFQIIFTNKVTDEQIYHLIDTLSQKKDHTPIVGAFLKWTRKLDDKIVSNWTYQVDKILHANLDLEIMQRRVGDIKWQ